MRFSSRLIDHVVMPVGSLDRTRAFLERLGFCVAPDAVHPFGTKNACVFFADGSYIEPLAVASRETCETEKCQGNIFVARDEAFRFRRGVPGFSALAFRSEDAARDLASFHAAGIGESEVFAFSRAFETAEGEAAELSFRLGFARDLRAPDASFFVCQAVHETAPDRSALTAHANGVTGVSRIVLSEPNPTDFQYFLQDVVNQRDIAADSFGMSLRAANAGIEVLTPAGLEMRYGGKRDESRGLLFEGLVLGAKDLGGLRGRLSANGIDFAERSGRPIVRLGTGSRNFIAFESETGR